MKWSNTIKFEGKISAIKDLSVFGVSEAAIISDAKYYSSLVPSKVSSNLYFDLMPVVANLAIANQFNSNGDGVSWREAAQIVQKIKNRPLNIEHKKDMIVGHIVNASLSFEEDDFNENDSAEFENINSPFFINICCVIYKHIYQDLSEAIEDASNPDSDKYQSISTSWELGYSDYKLVKTNSSRRLEGGQIIQDPMLANELKDKVNQQTSDGLIVNRLVIGDIYPLGAALTMSPAAKVKGVYVANDEEENYEKEEENDDDYEEDDEENGIESMKKSKIYSNNKKNKGENKNFCVDTAKDLKIMNEEQFTQLLVTVKESLASDKNIEISNANEIAKTIREALLDQSKDWASQIDAEKKENENLKSQVENLTNSNANLVKELDEVKLYVQQKIEAELFNARMNFVDANYNLNENESQIVVSEIKNLSDEEESFENYKTRLETIFAHRNKSFIEKSKEEEEARIASVVQAKLKEVKASSTGSSENIEEVEAELVTSDENESVPNNNQSITQKESLLERARKSFEVEIN